MRELERIQTAYQLRIDQGVIERYSLFREGELYMLQRREEEILKMLRKLGWPTLSRRRILEVGCGRGQRLAEFVRWGAQASNVVGLDLLRPFVEEAHRNYPGSHVIQASGHRLPFGAESFDLVAQYTVFTSIFDAGLKARIASEMLRVLKPGGILLWYDFRYPNPKNPDVRPVGKQEIHALFPDTHVTVASVNLLPPLARVLARYSFPLCRLLETFPPLRTHYLAAVVKN